MRAALLLMLLAGCDFNRTWDLGQPFAPLSVDSPTIPEDDFIDPAAEVGCTR